MPEAQATCANVQGVHETRGRLARGCGGRAQNTKNNAKIKMMMMMMMMVMMMVMVMAMAMARK